MRVGFVIIIFLFFLFESVRTDAQCPVADFTTPATVCVGENVNIINNSTGGANYAWDFCNGDLQNTPISDFSISQAKINRPSFIRVVSESGNWYGFVINRFEPGLARLDFGTSLSNTPTAVDLGTFGNAFVQPIDMKFYKENGVWYALLIDVSTNKLWRLTFSSLDLTPTLQQLTSFNSLNLLDAPVSIEILQENNTIIALATNYNGAKITQINFGSSITNSPSGVNISVPSASTLQGISATKICDSWNVITSSTTNNKIFLLTYSSGLTNPPVIAEIIPSGTPVIPSPMGVALKYDNGTSYAFIQSNGGDVYRILNAAGATPAGVNLGNLSAQGSGNEGIEMIKSATSWIGFLANVNTSVITRLSFPLSCSASKTVSFVQLPTGLQYNSAGTYQISLNAIDNSGNINSASKTITVIGNTSPSISVNTVAASCTAQSVSIAGSSSDPASSYVWDFGDGNTAAGQNVNHSYATAGTYLIQLTATASNGCNNNVTDTLSIYNPPSPDFALPSSPLLCTNQSYTFVNNSTYDAASNPTWNWLVNNVQQSTMKDFQFSFNSTSLKSIKLQVSIPGCSVEISKDITSLLAGPSVSFNAADGCANKNISFTNTTTDPVSGYLWDFGDSNTSTSANVTHAYSSVGIFTVTLTGSAANGCQNNITKDIKIYSNPATDFSIALPPFSCSGASTQFTDVTPGLTDSNVVLLQWDFGDPSSGQNTSGLKKPFHTYSLAGPYIVKLTTTTNAGCSTTIQKSANILQSPVASFTNTPACKDQTTTFSDTSTGNSQSWNWQIGSSFSILQQPPHIFTSPGNYTVNLGVTASNGCFGSTSKVITVPVPLTPDFSVQKNCTLQSTTFLDVTTSTSDPIIKDDWDFGVATGTGSPATFSFTTAGNYGVKLKVTAQSGCAYTAVKNVNIIKSPVASFTASPNAGVPPLIVQFNNTSSLATDYLWRFYDADSSPSTSNAVSPTHTFQELGNHIVDLVASNPQGCSNTISKVITAILPVNDVAITAFNIIKNADGSLSAVATLQNNGNVTLNNIGILMDLSGSATVRESIVASIEPKQSYNHLFNYQLTNISQLNYLCAEVPMEADVTPGDNRSCIGLRQQMFIYDPYPNPATNEFHIDLIANANESVSIAIVDALGKQVFLDSFQVDIGLNQYTLATDNFTAGVYIVIIQSNATKKVHQIAIMR